MAKIKSGREGNTMHCKTCGSTNVKGDAFCSWNSEQGEWEVIEVFYDTSSCEDCEDGCEIEERNAKGEVV